MLSRYILIILGQKMYRRNFVFSALTLWQFWAEALGENVPARNFLFSACTFRASEPVHFGLFG